MTQEIQANDAINAMLLREGITQGFDVFYLGIGEAEGFESDFRNKMALRGISKGGKIGYSGKFVSNFTGCLDGNDGSRSAGIKGEIQKYAVMILNPASENKERGIGIKS